MSKRKFVAVYGLPVVFEEGDDLPFTFSRDVALRALEGVHSVLQDKAGPKELGTESSDLPDAHIAAEPILIGYRQLSDSPVVPVEAEIQGILNGLSLVGIV